MVITATLKLSTKGHSDVVNITSQITREVAASGIGAGNVTVFVNGSTAGLTTIEYEPGIVGDFKAMWERVVPPDIQYDHDRAWGDGNGHSHVRASMLGPSLVVPFRDKRLLLGTWQQVVLLDFDNRPRTREVILQISGE